MIQNDLFYFWVGQSDKNICCVGYEKSRHDCWMASKRKNCVDVRIAALTKIAWDYQKHYGEHLQLQMREIKVRAPEMLPFIEYFKKVFGENIQVSLKTI